VNYIIPFYYNKIYYLFKILSYKSVTNVCAIASFISQVRNYSSQLSNGLPEPLSSLGYPNAICGNQYHSSSSGASECSESHQSYSNLSSVTEVSSYSGNKEYTKNDGGLLSIPEVGHTCLQQNRTDNGNSKNKSGLNIALKKIAEQLSLGEDDDDYIFSNQAHSVGGKTRKCFCLFLHFFLDP
jgi:calmodulin-binding transcription activator